MSEKKLPVESATSGQPFDAAGLNRPLSFILDVKERLENSEKERYDQFLAEFANYQESAVSAGSASENQVNLDTLRTEVKKLLAGHEDLLSEFEQLSTN